jgi:hypothetical protein
MKLASAIPSWVDALAARAIRSLPADGLADLIDDAKKNVFARLEALAATTENDVDDMLVAKAKEAFETCGPDADFLCDLVQRGEVAVVKFLAVAAQKTETQIDDAGVALLAKALGVSGVPT